MVILSKKVYIYICPIPNGFQDRAISLYSSSVLVSNVVLFPAVPHQCLKLVNRCEASVGH
jgi:hypothetical protein